MKAGWVLILTLRSIKGDDYVIIWVNILFFQGLNNAIAHGIVGISPHNEKFPNKYCIMPIKQAPPNMKVGVSIE